MFIPAASCNTSRGREPYFRRRANFAIRWPLQVNDRRAITSVTHFDLGSISPRESFVSSYVYPVCTRGWDLVLSGIKQLSIHGIILWARVTCGCLESNRACVLEGPGMDLLHYPAGGGALIPFLSNDFLLSENITAYAIMGRRDVVNDHHII